jgi:hypothetical protein
VTSFFSSRVSKFNLLVTLCALSLTTSGLSVMAAPQEACVKTSAGDIVCGQLVSKPIQFNGSVEGIRELIRLLHLLKLDTRRPSN